MLDFISFATCLLIIISTTLLLLLSIHHFQKPPHVRRRLSLPPSPFALPIVGHLHLLSPFLHRSLHDLSSRYGPLFHLRLGSVPCFVVSTPELAKKFLMTHELNFSSRKHSIAIDRLTYDSAFAFAPYGPYWKFLNKLCMSDLLGNRSINHSLPVRTRELNAFLQLVMKKANDCEAVNLTKELSKFTNTIISQMMIGVTGEAEEARTLAREGIRKRVEDIHSRYDALLERIITNGEHERKSPSLGDRHAKDFLDILLDVSEDDNLNIKCNRDQIKGLILCFEWKAVNQSGVKMNGDGVVDMTEQPGMTAPRAHDLVCMPIARINQLYTLLNP
ncbi:Licodione synthase [Camellia lanceoleosa]|uniref:Licodione synthase n=1 Tax=Camellia lanceoleosa TaxID=1840588 RepID=A0ACC0F3K7_9ERIC|nr:Licodione synthase [Camellia lanceoleosa]